MEDSRTVSAAAAFAAAALGFALAAQAQPVSPKRDVAPRAAPGSPGMIVQHEESPGGRILYFEEKGGMAIAVPAPVKANGANGHGKAVPDTARRAPPLPPRLSAPDKK